MSGWTIAAFIFTFYFGYFVGMHVAFWSGTRNLKEFVEWLNKLE